MLGMLIALFAGNAVCALFVFLRLRLYRMLSLRGASREKLRQMLKYSLPLVPNVVCWWFFTASDRLIVTTVLGIEASGVLAIAYKLTSVINVFIAIFALAWTESAALHIDDPDKDAFFRKVIGQGAASFSSMIILLLAAIPFLFPFMIDAQYSEELAARAREWPPARVAATCGITVDEVVGLARDYGTIKPAAIRLNYGMQRVHGGANAVRAIRVFRRWSARGANPPAARSSRRRARSRSTRRHSSGPI
jgi:hypothetical protein